MTRIFISYRREDSAGQAGRLFDYLAQRFGEDNVFMDTDTIDLGRDFKPVLQEAVAKCDLMLVVIGTGWIDCIDPATNTRRLDNPDDWVRIEIAEALRRDIPVIPVLVRGAPLPRGERLPGEIAALADRQAIAISDNQWRAGVADLVRRLEAVPRRQEREWAEKWVARIGVRRFAAIMAAAVIILVGAIWTLWPVPVEVPLVTGKSLAAAQAELEAAGLTLPDGAATEEESLTVKAGTVIRQEPSAGLRVSRRDPVRIIVAKFPPPVDLSSFVEIRNIKTEGIIGAAAIVTALEVAFAKSAREVRLSERYLHEKARLHDELEKGSEGTWMTALVYVAETFGIPALELWPFKVDEHTPPEGVTWAQLDTAARSHKATFHRVDGLREIYEHLRAGRPVVATVAIGPDWSTPSATQTGRVVVNPSSRAQEQGKGAVAIVGFHPETGVFRFAHCWSVTWGDRGFGTMSVKTAEALINPQQTWAIEAAKDN